MDHRSPPVSLWDHEPERARPTMVARPALVSEQDQTPVLPGPGPGSEPSGLSMDVLTLLRLVVRHWRVTAPALLLTLVGLVALLQAASPTY